VFLLVCDVVVVVVDGGGGGVCVRGFEFSTRLIVIVTKNFATN
jgi:hypothetical protein